MSKMAHSLQPGMLPVSWGFSWVVRRRLNRHMPLVHDLGFLQHGSQLPRGRRRDLSGQLRTMLARGTSSLLPCYWPRQSQHLPRFNVVEKQTPPPDQGDANSPQKSAQNGNCGFSHHWKIQPAIIQHHESHGSKQLNIKKKHLKLLTENTFEFLLNLGCKRQR